MLMAGLASFEIGTGKFLLLCRRLIAYWRAVVLLPVLALAVLLIAHHNFFALLPLAAFLIFIASQFFWISCILDVAGRFIPGKLGRVWLATIAGLIYLFVFAYSYPDWDLNHTIRASDYRPQSILIDAAFWWWVVGSTSSFLLIIAFATLDRASHAAVWMYRKARQGIQRPSAPNDSCVALASNRFLPDRRRFLKRSAVLVSATPFVAAGYGLLYERTNVEVVGQRVRLVRLPPAFEGFRIAQLSDIHLGPFSNADYIRRCVAITNGLKPDLIALTGDYVTRDPEAQTEVVRALAGLQAPHGIFGCLGNHEADTRIEKSITRLFDAQGIRILRGERAPVTVRDATLNLIGIDNGSDVVPTHTLEMALQQLKGLVMPDLVNLLLIHYPVFFGYPGLDIDLTLAGDLHGGQLSLDFLHRGLNLAHLFGVPYDSGLYQKDGAQLYMNRGIGTTGFPIRLGARPEITLLELTRT
jgi:predicted MPP superfamily phosphohydrolase